MHSDTTTATMPPAEPRFTFGKNWAGFLGDLKQWQIDAATTCLAEKLNNVTGQTFLDIGCGSGIHSLAALRLGAVRVHSFDYDLDSVTATSSLRSRFAPGADWIVEQGSVLDESYLRGLGDFDIVYAWGVLHHTGDMWRALNNVAERVSPGGRLFLSIYNDQGLESRLWKGIKRRYVNAGRPVKKAIELFVWSLVWGRHFLWDLAVLKPLRTYKLYRQYGRDRGMSAWHDVVDWAGGYPFEVASPDKVFEFYRDRRFVLQQLRTCGGGKGCNQFVFKRSALS